MSSFDSPPIGPVDAMEFSEPPAWPKVVGIVSICWAGLGLFCTGCGVLSILMMPQLMKSAEAQLGPMPDIMKPTGTQLILAVVGLLPIGLLMLAGILTLRRKPAGAIAHLVYGGLGVLMGLIGTGVGVMHQLEVQAWAQQNASSKWAQQAGSPFAWVGLVVGVLIGVMYPFFCLVWFGLVKRNADMGKDEPVSI